MTSPYISFLYSFFNPSLPSTYISSNDKPPFDTPSLHSLTPFLHSLNPSLPSTYISSYDYSPFDTPTLYSLSILLIYSPAIKNCCGCAAQLPLGFPLVTRPTTHMTSPLLTLQLYTFSLPPLYSIHPLSTSPLYKLNIVGYCHGTAQSLLGSRHVTRQSPPYD